MKMMAGSRMRERRKSGSERGQGAIVGGPGVVRSGWGNSLNNTQEDGGGSPAGLAKNRGSTRRPPLPRDPALLAQTKREVPAGDA
jgi:hypothetical protein